MVGVLLENPVNTNPQMVYGGWAATYQEHCRALEYYQAQQGAKGSNCMRIEMLFLRWLSPFR